MKYVRLNITTEGPSEMEFAKKYLAEYLAPFGVIVDARSVMTSKNRFKKYRGGLSSYERVKNDVLNWIKEESKNEGVFFTTMFDLYALPNDFPNFETSLKQKNPYTRIEFLEKSLSDDINVRNFIPYLQLHEFEALLLANPKNLAVEYDNAETKIQQLEHLLSTHQGNPELINTGTETAPSKQIIKLIPEYKGNKVTVGVHLAGFDGIGFLKQKCPHFDKWVTKLEQLSL
ncbi:MAG: DUF4276 family protein [Cytophagia bacterium]|nr:MAG: DUF4276 family protein [Runella sp.]TAG22582.1 MAG: DUF4276 family protein [Cytophagales bacterium]TAG41715.1 MAG: DUF4276 family protein [Cytophagia bacterium]TAG83410.1 MAG: DUF4276 family protein [Cytophagales bacterium]